MEFIFAFIVFVLLAGLLGRVLGSLFFPVIIPLFIWFCFWLFTWDNKILEFVECKDQSIASIMSEVGTLDGSKVSVNSENCKWAQCRVFAQLDDLLEKGDIVALEETLSPKGNLIASTIIKSTKIDPSCP
tara:strand:- start:15 stop:404 length:390 start_codon:yes stop_codon:yes gene_type:complete